MTQNVQNELLVCPQVFHSTPIRLGVQAIFVRPVSISFAGLRRFGAPFCNLYCLAGTIFSFFTVMSVFHPLGLTAFEGNQNSVVGKSVESHGAGKGHVSLERFSVPVTAPSPCSRAGPARPPPPSSSQHTSNKLVTPSKSRH
eukprot:2518312-Rhodomonas_salina.2